MVNRDRGFYKLGVRNEELGKRLTRKPSLTPNSYFLITPQYIAYPLFFLFAICSLLFVSCNLFSVPADPNYFDKIDEEIAWANAAKLTVTLVNPLEWGSSPQAGTGACRDDKRDAAPRVAYPFTLQFTPSAAYGDAQWRAYKTSDLPSSENWYISAVGINTILDGLDVEGKRLSPDKVSFSPEAGNRTTAICFINDAITIIPWTVRQPRIVNSSPPLEATSDNFIWGPNRDITITFAESVDQSTLQFNTGYIEITGKDAETGNPYPYPDGDMQGLFSAILYDDDTNTLTIRSGGFIPDGIIVTVKLGD